MSAGAPVGKTDKWGHCGSSPGFISPLSRQKRRLFVRPQQFCNTIAELSKFCVDHIYKPFPMQYQFQNTGII
jgi:hypothetical protein